MFLPYSDIFRNDDVILLKSKKIIVLFLLQKKISIEFWSEVSSNTYNLNQEKSTVL